MSYEVVNNNSFWGRNHVVHEVPDLSHMDYPGILKHKPLWEIIVKTFFYFPVIVFGIIGNVIIIAVVAKNKRMQTTTNYYIVNLAVADCLVALTCSWTHLVDDLTPFWALGSFFCTFNTFSQGLRITQTTLRFYGTRFLDHRFYSHLFRNLQSKESLYVSPASSRYERWQCCSGFQRKPGEQGCSQVKPLDNIVETSRDLGLSEFVSQAEGANLLEDLSLWGPYTVFAPTNEAMADVSPDVASQFSPGGAATSLLSYHVAPGRLNVSTFRDRNQEFVTLHNGDRVRVNKYAYGVATVNCARIIRPDEMATNGVVHVIDKVINPADIRGNLAEKVMKDDRFSQFQMALLVSDMIKKLKSSSYSFTILAPTNQAFSKLPSDILDQILTDADTAEKVLQRHIVRGVYCADAIVVAVGLKTMDEARLLFRCKRDGLWINEAKVVHPDLVASNGVIHGIDTVLLPDTVKTAPELLQDMHLFKFLELVNKSGINYTLAADNITLFIPTDQAFRELPPKYLAALSKEPLKMGELAKYHMVKGHIAKGELVGETALDTLAELDIKIKVKVTRKGVTLDKATIEEEESARECKNAVVHKLDKVMIPPENSLLDHILDDPELRLMLRKSGMDELLLPGGSYTVIAPTNRAFAQVDQKQLQQILDDKKRLLKYVERHIIGRMVLKCSVPENGVYTLLSYQKDETDFAFDSRKRLYVNRHARTVSDDILTSNGVLYKVDHVLPCTCEPTLRTIRGQYFTSHSYRRRY